MSGVVKSVKKKFRKVTKKVGKLAPIALAAGATFFTLGKALNITGSFGDVLGKVVNGFGVNPNGQLGRVLTSSVAKAGYGAAIGSIMGTKGMQYGALAGGVLGGLSAMTNVGLTASNGGANTQNVSPNSSNGTAENAYSSSASPYILPAAIPPNQGKNNIVSGIGNIIQSPIALSAAAAAAQSFADGRAEDKRDKAIKSERDLVKNSYNLNGSLRTALPQG